MDKMVRLIKVTSDTKFELFLKFSRIKNTNTNSFKCKYLIVGRHAHESIARSYEPGDCCCIESIPAPSQQHESKSKPRSGKDLPKSNATKTTLVVAFSIEILFSLLFPFLRCCSI